jgi:hypothetical protein
MVKENEGGFNIEISNLSSSRGETLAGSLSNQEKEKKVKGNDESTPQQRGVDDVSENKEVLDEKSSNTVNLASYLATKEGRKLSVEHSEALQSSSKFEGKYVY